MAAEISQYDFQMLVSALLSANNDERAAGEKAYENLKAITRLTYLFQVLSERNLTEEVVNLAAVLLRRLITSEFEDLKKELSEENIVQIKTQMILLIRNTPDAVLKRRVSECAAELARHFIDEKGNNSWPEFLEFIFESVGSTDVSLKESALNIFYNIPGIFGNRIGTVLEMVKQILLTCLASEEMVVRVNAFKATCAFILYYDDNKAYIETMKQLLDPMLIVIKQALPLPTSHCDSMLKLFVDLPEKVPNFFRQRYAQMFEMVFSALPDPKIDSELKNLLIEIIIYLAENAPSTFRKRGSQYIPQLITYLLETMCLIEDDDEWDTADAESEDVESDNLAAEMSLDRLACSIGGKTVLPIAIAQISLMLQSPEWKRRCAAMMAISAIGEGCHKQMLQLLPKIIEGILPFLTDQHPRVRHAACNALGQMATDFAPEFQEMFHAVIVPKLLSLFDDHGNPRVQAHACAALVNFIEECSKEQITIYLGTIAAKLEQLIQIKIKELSDKSKRYVLEQAIVVTSSLADTSEKDFAPYYDKFVPFLKFIIENALTEELKKLRGKAIECISLIGLAVGKERFCKDATDVMNLLLATQTGDYQLADDDPQLSFMISSWTRICKILGPDFKQYLPFVMPPVMKAASIKITVAVMDKEDAESIGTNSDWQCVSLSENQTFGIKTTGLEEKATACQMLVCYARELGVEFIDYVEETAKILVPLLKFHFHDGVRSAAAESLPHLIDCAKARDNTFVGNLWTFMFPELISAIENESESDVLMELMISLAQCIEKLGVEFLTPKIFEDIAKLLNTHFVDFFERGKERMEKRKDEDFDEGAEEALLEEDEEDAMIVNRITDIVHACFSTAKEHFLPYFDLVVPHFVQMAQAGLTKNEKNSTIFVFDDVVEYCRDKCIKYRDIFLPLFASGIQSEHAEIRQSSAYGWGLLGLYGGESFSAECAGAVPFLVQMIQMVDARSPTNVGATENAISAITKIMRYNGSQLNVNEILPVWLSWLPISEDVEEIIPVYDFLLYLVEHNHPLIIGDNNANLARVVQLVIELISRNVIPVEKELIQKMLVLLNSLKANIELFNRCAQSLDPQQRQQLEMILLGSAQQQQQQQQQIVQ